MTNGKKKKLLETVTAFERKYVMEASSTKEGILEGIISELSYENYQQLSNKRIRNISRQGQQCRQSHRNMKPYVHGGNHNSLMELPGLRVHGGEAQR